MEPKKMRVIVSTVPSNSSETSSKVAKGHKHVSFLAGFFFQKVSEKRVTLKQGSVLSLYNRYILRELLWLSFFIFFMIYFNIKT